MGGPDSTLPSLDDTPPRPAPQVILVPPTAVDPATVGRIGTEYWLIGSGVAIVLLLAGLCVILSPSSSWHLRTIFIAGPLLIGSLVIILPWLGRRWRVRWRATFVEQHPESVDDPRAAALIPHWPVGRGDVFTEQLRSELLVYTLAPDRGVVVASFGEPKVLEVGDYRFQPEIITPTTLQPGVKMAGGIVLALSAAWIAQVNGWLVGPLHWLGGALPIFTGAVAGAAAGSVGWLWRTFVVPRYIRLAPGMVQCLYYTWTGKCSEIRSFPMTAGTLVLCLRKGAARIFVFDRDDHTEKITLAMKGRHKHLAEQIWQAILSTAPTPPLDDQELVG